VDFYGIAFLEAKRLDYRLRKADRQAISPSRYLHLQLIPDIQKNLCISYLGAKVVKDVRPRCATHRGSDVDPIKNLSTACAHWRPSRIAQTTSDWPRRMSPAANTFGLELW
jgi:hypothetical protein